MASEFFNGLSIAIWFVRTAKRRVVYAKPLFTGRQEVLDYVGRYTDRSVKSQ
jgi:hypothetical protein